MANKKLHLILKIKTYRGTKFINLNYVAELSTVGLNINHAPIQS